MFNKTFFAAIVLFASTCGATFADDEKVGLSGKVTDQESRPVPHAQVYVRDRELRMSVSTSTDRRGHYAVNHFAANRCNILVVPPLKTNLAQATYKDVPAREGRHMLVSLRPGFKVSGRVIAAGNQPLKGVTVRVQTEDKDSVHGGGETTTDGKGRFSIVLTPGPKIFEITDVGRSDVPGFSRHNYTVTGEASMPDIIVPFNTTTGSAK